MTTRSRQNVQTVLQTLQLLALIVGIGGLFLTVGRKDATLENNTSEIRDLRAISTDLVKASIESTTTNREQDRRLEDLRARIARLETTP